MHPDDIQAAWKKNGYTQKKLAQMIGRSELHLSKVIHKERASDYVCRKIPEAAGLASEEAFPEYYQEREAKARARAEQIH